MTVGSKPNYDTIENWVSRFKDAAPGLRPAIAKEWLNLFVAKQTSARAHTNMLAHTTTIREMVWAIPKAKDVERRTKKWLTSYLLKDSEDLSSNIDDLYALWLSQAENCRLAALSRLAKKSRTEERKVPQMGVVGCDWLRTVAWDTALDSSREPAVLEEVLDLVFREYPWDYATGAVPSHPIDDAIGVVITRCKKGFAHLAGSMSTEDAKVKLIQCPQVALSLLRFVETGNMNSKTIHGERPSEARKLKILATWVPGYKPLLKTAGNLGMSYMETMDYVHGQIIADVNQAAALTLPDDLGIAQ